MPSLIIPDTRTMYVYPQSGNTSDFNTYKTLQGCISGNDIVDAPDGEDTISRGDYLKKYFFDNKYDDIITFDKVVCSDYQQYWSGGMYIDGENNDYRLSLFSSTTMNSYVLAFNLWSRLKDNGMRNTYNSAYNSMFAATDDNINCFLYANNGDSNYTRVNAKNFDSFSYLQPIRVWRSWHTDQRLAGVANIIYDIENKEILYYTPSLDIVLLSTLESRSYAQILTKDGHNGTIAYPAFRKCSIEEVSYAPVTRIDGIEATRFYMLTQFPEASAWETLHVGDKYLLVLPYDTSTSTGLWGSNGHEMHCAIAIDVTEDLANQ